MTEEILKGKLSSIFELGKQYQDLDWYSSDISGSREEQEDFEKQQLEIIDQYNIIVDEIIKEQNEQAEEIRYLELQLDLANDELRYGDGL